MTYLTDTPGKQSTGTGVVSATGSPAVPRDTRSRFSLRRTVFGSVTLINLGIFLALILSAWMYGYLRIFVVPPLRDDEGYMMIAFKQFNDGAPLYDGFFSQYGPFYYLYHWLAFSLLGTPVTHDATRIITLAHWVATAALCALAVQRMTRSWPIAFVSFVHVFLYLSTIIKCAGHPQGLVLVLMAAGLFWVTLFRWGQPSGVGLLVLGMIVGGLALSKINTGVFSYAAVMVMLSLYAERRMLYRVLFLLTASATAALPLLLMWRHALTTPWGAKYCATVTMSILAVLVTGAFRERLPLFRFRHFALFHGGLVLCAGATIVLAMAHGTTAWGLLNGILLRSVFFPNNWVIPGDASGRGAILSLVAAGLAAACVMQDRPLGLSRYAVFRCLYWLKLIVAAVIFYQALRFGGNPGKVLSFSAPFIWLLLIPNGPGTGADENEGVARTLLATTLMLHTMQGYPVWGDQGTWSTFLFLLMLAVLVRDVLPKRFTRPITVKLGADPEGATVRVAREWPVYCVSAVLILLIVTYGADVKHHWNVYRQNMPLRLPGADRIRLSPSDVGIWTWLTHNLKQHADTHAGLPGLNSLYFWTQTDPPTGFNSAVWMSLLTDEEQSAIVERLSTAKRPCVIYNSDLTRWFLGWVPRDVSKRPLFRYIREEFRTVFSAGDFEFMVKRDRNPETLADWLLPGERSFRGPGDCAPLPPNLLNRLESLTLSLVFRTTESGVLLGLQDEPWLSRPSQEWLPVLYVGTDGCLLAQWSTAAGSPITSANFTNDGAWHRVVLVVAADCQTLYLDGELVGRVECPSNIAQLKCGQLGAGLTGTWPAVSGQVTWFRGSVKDAFVIHRLLDQQELVGPENRSGGD